MNMEVEQTVARGNNECYNLHYDFSLSAKIIGLTPRAPIMNASSSSKVNTLKNIFKTTKNVHEGKYASKPGIKTRAQIRGWPAIMETWCHPRNALSTRCQSRRRRKLAWNSVRILSRAPFPVLLGGKTNKKEIKGNFESDVESVGLKTPYPSVSSPILQVELF